MTTRRGLQIAGVLAFLVFLCSALCRPLLLEREFRRQIKKQIESETDTKFPKHQARVLLASTKPDYAKEVIWCLFHPLTQVHTMHLFLTSTEPGSSAYAIASAKRDQDGKWTLHFK